MRSRNAIERGATWIFTPSVALLALVGCRSGSLPRTDPAPADIYPNIVQFGQLVGNWHIEQQVRQQDGSWEAVDPAEWNFHYAIGGYAVQDQWIQPSRSVSLEPGETRQYGTNLRIYDPALDSWHIVWASNDQAVFTTYTARANERGVLVMTGEDPTRPGVTQRITYFDITESQWHWRMEFSNDGVNWLEVARIQATRMN